MKAVIHLAGNIAPVLAGLVTSPLTARSLGPSARGELAILLLVASIVGLVGAMGLGLLARRAVAEDLGQAHGWSRRGRRITLFAMAFSIVAGVFIARFLGLAVNEAWAAAALFAFAGMSASRSIDGNILIVAGRIKQYGTANLAASASVSLGIVVFFSLGLLNLWIVIALNAASLVIQMLCISIPMRRLLGSTVESSFVPEPFGRLISRAWRAWRSQILEASVIRADTLLFAAQTNVQTVGLYAVVSLIPQMTYQVVQTLIQASYAASPSLRFRVRVRVLWQVTVVVGVLLAVLGSIAAIPLIPLLFGHAFEPAVGLLLPAALVTIGLAALAPALHHYATSTTQDSWFPLTLLFIASACWLAGDLLTPSWGVALAGALFLALSATYMYLLAGWKAFVIRRGDWLRLYGC